MTDAFRVALTRRSGTSGVRAIALSETADTEPVEAIDVQSEIPPSRRLHPSDHPTIAAPLATLTMLGSDAAEDAPATGLRLGHVPLPPADPRPDRPTEPNLWIHNGALTFEQEHGFSNPDAAAVESRWQLAQREADTGPMQTRPKDEQSRTYVIAGVLTVVLVLALTFGLAWALHS
jgi:hypothetical protein